MEVESVVGLGSTFTLYLPQVAETAARSDEAVKDNRVVDGAGRRVLVVEDNVSVGQFAMQVLEDLHFEAEWVTNAEDALHRLGEYGGGFDVVFSDIVMPGMGGIELAKRLRQDLPRMPVALASGYSHTLAQDGVEGIDLLRKPYSAVQLSTLLDRMIRTAIL